MSDPDKLPPIGKAPHSKRPDVARRVAAIRRAAFAFSTSTGTPDFASEGSYNSASVEELAARLADAKARGAQAAVLLGAGASESAGIPLARILAKQAAEKHPLQVKGCSPEDYPLVMGKLDAAQRNGILAPYIKEANINAAHLFLADLVRNGYIDLILTTNFDPLIVQGLAYADVRPYIYDVANLMHFDAPQVRTPAVLYLHGQFGAFVNVHSEAEAQRLRDRVQQIYAAFLGNHAFIVVGYAGDDRDPVFSELCKRYQFTCSLFWAYHRDAGPKPHVFKGLLEDKTKSAHYVRAQPADVFFSRLGAALKVESANLSRKPFTFLSEALAHVAPLKAEDTDEDLTQETRQWVADARECFEAQRPCARYQAERKEFIRQDIVKRAREAWMEQRFDALDALLAEAGREQATQAYGYLARALVQRGTQICYEARTAPPSDRAQKFRDACDKFRKAAELKPDDHQAFNNWGTALDDLGRLLPKDEAIIPFRDACDKFRQAADLKPDYHQAFYNWGNALAGRARLLPKDEAIIAFRDACDKFRQATELKPDFHRAFNNWGSALGGLARLLPKDEAIPVFRDAGTKNQKAIELKPDDHEAFYNWGTTLGDLAPLLPRDEAIPTFRDACDKFRQATELKPDDHEAFYNWDTALGRLYRLVDEAEKPKVLAEVERVSLQGNKAKPGFYDYNLACVAALKGEKDRAFELLDKVLAAGSETAEQVEADEDFSGLHDDRRWKPLMGKYWKKPEPPTEPPPDAAKPA